jgi:hypothetical protein
MKWDVLTSTIEGSDEPAYYNSYVGGKWYRPIESFQDPEWKKKISQSMLTSKLVKRGENHYQYKGKAEFYLDGKRMVVDCIGSWANENGYDRGRLTQIANTYKYGFCKDNSRPKGIRSRFKHKGPLGTITKVRWLVDSG